MGTSAAADNSEFSAHAERMAHSLWQARRLVVVAEPGSGKTTRLPLALLKSAPAPRDGRRPGQIWVLEPRRLAARLAATYVAELHGDAVGETIGYRVRHDDCSGPKTRIVYMTDGILARHMLQNPTLQGVDAVLFDEFHERSLAQDSGLAALWQRQRTGELQAALAVLSATLDAQRVSRWLGDAPIAHVAGRVFPIEVQHAPHTSRAPLPQQVLAAVQARLVHPADDGGDILVFLPGPAAIDACAQALASCAKAHGAICLPLYARLPLAAQQRAVRKQAQRKIILSTNVAETSVTIVGVTCVIDAGLAFVAAQAPGSGIASLQLRPISQASATQRAGRAGRMGPGVCVRLYTQAEHYRREAHDIPEVQRLDVAPIFLWLQAQGQSPAALPWLDAPPPAAIAAAQTLLQRLGACTPQGGLTAMGRRMAALPLHPRLARIVVAGVDTGIAKLACQAVAVLGAPDEAPTASGAHAAHVHSDLYEACLQLPRVSAWQSACEDVRRALRAHLPRDVPATPPDAAAAEDTLAQAVLHGFSDRLAKRLPPLGPRPGKLPLALAQGGRAYLHEHSQVRQSDWLLALSSDIDSWGQAPQVRVRMAQHIDPSWLLDRTDGFLQESDQTICSRGGRALRRTQISYDGMVLFADEVAETDPARAAQALAALWHEKHVHHVPRQQAEAVLQARLAWLAICQPSLPPTSPEALQQAIGASVAALAHGQTRVEDIALAQVFAHAEQLLGQQVQAALAAHAPMSVQLPHGKRLSVQYSAEAAPYVASYLQDFFGSARGIRLGSTQAPLCLHLWGPNARPLQITQDLHSFWQQHYPPLRRTLMRRYPRHAWPEDPIAATPPPPRAKGRGR